MTLSGRTAIVTGAGRGIGEAVARAFAAEGARVAMVARTASELHQVAAAICAEKGAALPIVADVRSTPDVERAVRAAIDWTGAIDILVNNAGVYGPIGPFAETDLDAWWDALETNLGGALRFCHAVLPHMTARRSGKIINLSGGGATSPLPNLTAYSVSKTAVVRLTENLGEELKSFNIDVNAIAPGPVDTKLQDQLLESGARAGSNLYERIRKMRETGAGGVPPSLAAELAVFLASPASDGLTGKLISAPHDPWRDWIGRGTEITDSALFTLRRLDSFTITPLKNLK